MSRRIKRVYSYDYTVRTKWCVTTDLDAISSNSTYIGGCCTWQGKYGPRRSDDDMKIHHWPLSSSSFFYFSLASIVARSFFFSHFSFTHSFNQSINQSTYQCVYLLVIHSFAGLANRQQHTHHTTTNRTIRLALVSMVVEAKKRNIIIIINNNNIIINNDDHNNNKYKNMR